MADFREVIDTTLHTAAVEAVEAAVGEVPAAAEAVADGAATLSADAQDPIALALAQVPRTRRRLRRG